jgi:hypothetical protein
VRSRHSPDPTPKTPRTRTNPAIIATAPRRTNSWHSRAQLSHRLATECECLALCGTILASMPCTFLRSRHAHYDSRIPRE